MKTQPSPTEVERAIKNGWDNAVMMHGELPPLKTALGMVADEVVKLYDGYEQHREKFLEESLQAIADCNEKDVAKYIQKVDGIAVDALSKLKEER